MSQVLCTNFLKVKLSNNYIANTNAKDVLHYLYKNNYNNCRSYLKKKPLLVIFLITY